MTEWRDLAGLMAACFLALLLVAPTGNAGPCLCAGDMAVSEVAVESAQTDQQDGGHPCEAACCVSGHCHHGAPMLKPVIAPVPALAPVDAKPSGAIGRALASVTSSGLERPPRA